MQTDISLIEKTANGLRELAKIQETSYTHQARDCVFQREKVRLYHYQPRVKTTSIPLLIVFAAVNRPEILELNPEKSFLRALLNEGMDVYLLDWGYPDESDAGITFSNYVGQYLKYAAAFMALSTGQPKINLLGICQGGVMSLCHAALEDNINKLVLISTPVDFCTEDHAIAGITKRLDAKAIRKSQKNIPGKWLTHFFISLRSAELIGKKWVNLVDKANDVVWTQQFLRMEKWLHDTPDQACAAFADWIQYFYQENRLISGKMEINEMPVKLSHVRAPVLNVIASQDVIVPSSASSALARYIPKSNYQQLTVGGGHIGIYVNERVNRHLAAKIAAWLNTA